MNIEETKHAIEVMQGYVDGKDIEFRKRMLISWRPYKNPDTEPWWDWLEFEYRIAPPKPRECYVKFDNKGRPYHFFEGAPDKSFILMREVIEENS